MRFDRSYIPVGLVEPKIWGGKELIKKFKIDFRNLIYNTILQLHENLRVMLLQKILLAGLGSVSPASSRHEGKHRSLLSDTDTGIIDI